jgi:hypothetical protein
MRKNDHKTYINTLGVPHYHTGLPLLWNQREKWLFFQVLSTVWSLFYYWTSKPINIILPFPSFPNSHHLRANFPNYKGPGPQIQMSRKISRILLSALSPFIIVVCKKWSENLHAVVSNVQVGDNWSSTSNACTIMKQIIIHQLLYFSIKEKWQLGAYVSMLFDFSVVSHFSFVSTWKRSHFPLWFQSSGMGALVRTLKANVIYKIYMKTTEKWWEYREKSKYFSNCTTFHICGALSWHSYVIMYLLCIEIYSVVV